MTILFSAKIAFIYARFSSMMVFNRSYENYIFFYVFLMGIIQWELYFYFLRNKLTDS